MNDQRQSRQIPFFRVWLCGAFRVERSAGTASEAVRTAEWGGSSYPRLLLKALLCSRGRQARRDALIEMLWPDTEPEQAVQNLNTATTKLRNVLRPTREQESLLLTENDATIYRLPGQELLWVDADEALAVLKEAERLGRTSPEAIPLLERATEYFNQGTLLDGEEGLWASGKRATMERVCYRARLWLAEAYEQQGMPGQAEMVISLLLEEDPTDEDALNRLLLLLHRQGMTQKALRLYEHACQVFAQEGTEPGESVKQVAAQLSGTRYERVLPSNDGVPLISAFPQTVAHGLLSTTSEQRRDATEEQRLPHSREHGNPLEVVLSESEDPSIWFGRKLAYLLTLVEEYYGQLSCCLDLQEQFGKELNRICPKTPDEGYTPSRRQALITLATLPTALLLTILKGRFSAGRVEHLLTRCAASLVACWHLMRGCEYAIVEDILPSYLPLLTNLAQESSKYQRVAASLATQGYRLKGILALHRNDSKVQYTSFQQAISFAEIAQDPGLLVAALISRAYHLPDPDDAEQLYLKAFTYEHTISPLQRSRLFIECAVAFAQQNREDEARALLHRAQACYPTSPENDPSFLYAEFSPASMILEQGRVFLALAQHPHDGRYAQQAWETFASAQPGSLEHITAERVRYEIINYQAETALALQDRDLCCASVKQGLQGAMLLGSARRKKEIVATRNKALRQWLHDERVKELKYFFT